MANADTKPGIAGPLAPECAAVLNLWDAYAEPSSLPGWAHIRDEEGTLIASLPSTIDANMLNALFNHGQRMQRRGEQIGEERAKQRLRAALGV